MDCLIHLIHAWMQVEHPDLFRAEHEAGASRRNSLLQGGDSSALNQGQHLQSPDCAQELPSLPKRAFLAHKYSTNGCGHWQLI